MVDMRVGYTLEKAVRDYRRLTAETAHLEPETAAAFAQSAVGLVREGLGHAPRLQGLLEAVAAGGHVTSQEVSGEYSESSTRTGLLELTRAGLITRGRHPRQDGQVGASPWVYWLTPLGERVIARDT
jgi:hypothetical protein